jgi:Flp pilus assembly protein TadG
MRRARNDRGAVIVEAALVLPLFIAVILGLIDLGYAVFQTSQATNAARDGARAAILSYGQADVSGSSDNARVVAQVKGRLAGQTVKSIKVSCLSGQSGSTTVACADASPNSDRIRVAVSWTYTPLTPAGAVVGTITISGTATMGIVGSPQTPAATTTTSSTTTTTAPVTTTQPSGSSTTTTTSPSSTTSTTQPSTTTTSIPPGSCVVTGLNVSPLPIRINGSGHLTNTTTFTVTTNGAATCTALQIQYPTSPSVKRGMLSGGGNIWTDTVTKNELNWVSGNNLTVNVLDSTGTLLPGGAFQVTVS